jgi:glutathione S-transferase
MRLIGSVTSPYARFVRVTLAELGVEHEFTITGPFGKMSPEDERRIDEANPLMTLSTLLVNGGYRQC